MTDSTGPNASGGRVGKQFFNVEQYQSLRDVKNYIFYAIEVENNFIFILDASFGVLDAEELSNIRPYARRSHDRIYIKAAVIKPALKQPIAGELG